jgi:hypothetical protein
MSDEDEDRVFSVAEQPNGFTQYIVRNKERAELGGPIQEVDVVRPGDGRLSTIVADRANWKIKSTQCCPTYGNCTRCYRSGPTGMACGFCNHEFAGYKLLYWRDVYFDAQWIAGWLRLDGHVTAMADRKVGWLTTPIERIHDVKLKLIIKKVKIDDDITSEPERERIKQETWEAFSAEIKEGERNVKNED